jgi:hypothetical protein
MNTYERAIQIYQVLIAAAHNRQLLTYEIVGGHIGVPKQGLAGHLEHILRYCERRRLPPLTSICVSKRTGLPSHGFTDRVSTTPEELHREREAVYAHNWYGERPVTVADLQATTNERNA